MIEPEREGSYLAINSYRNNITLNNGAVSRFEVKRLHNSRVKYEGRIHGNHPKVDGVKQREGLSFLL